jgi:hypothetical protein
VIYRIHSKPPVRTNPSYGFQNLVMLVFEVAPMPDRFVVKNTIAQLSHFLYPFPHELLCKDLPRHVWKSWLQEFGPKNLIVSAVEQTRPEAEGKFGYHTPGRGRISCASDAVHGSPDAMFAVVVFHYTELVFEPTFGTAVISYRMVQRISECYFDALERWIQGSAEGNIPKVPGENFLIRFATSIIVGFEALFRKNMSNLPKERLRHVATMNSRERETRLATLPGRKY